MRVMIGIPVEKHINDTLQKVLLHSAFPDKLRGPRMELHLTLKAPQTIPDSQVAEWIDAAAAAVSPDQTNLTITGADFITAYTLSLTVDSPKLALLHEGLKQSLRSYDTEIHGQENGRFSPHITIGRTHQALPPQVKKAALQLTESAFRGFPPFQAQAVRIYGKHGGAPYQMLKDIKLSDN